MQERANAPAAAGDAVQQQEQEQELGQEPCSVPLSPPEGSQRITPDGGVLKYILQEGSGAPPELHARCLGASRDVAGLECDQMPRAAGHAALWAAAALLLRSFVVLACETRAPVSAR